jgi:hypothetical protein
MVDIISEVSCYAAFGKRVQPAGSVYDCTPQKYVSGEMFTCGKNADSESEPSVIFRTPAVG